jgi:hypothetical protein
MLAWIMANKEIVGIGLALVLAMLPPDSKIKVFLNALIARLTGQTPTPPPVVDPNNPNVPVVPVTDVSQLLMQILMNVLLKAKAAGNAKTMEATLDVIDQVKAEHAELVRQSAPPPAPSSFQYPPRYFRMQ